MPIKDVPDIKRVDILNKNTVDMQVSKLKHYLNRV